MAAAAAVEEGGNHFSSCGGYSSRSFGGKPHKYLCMKQENVGKTMTLTVISRDAIS
jgi:hypothetical protein